LSRRGYRVDELHLRVHGALRSVERREPVDPGIRHLDDPDRLAPRGGGRLDTGALENDLEDRGFSGLGKAEQAHTAHSKSRGQEKGPRCDPAGPTETAGTLGGAALACQSDERSLPSL